MLQLMYNIHTCDHAMCPHFHHRLCDTFAISFFITIHIDIISRVTNVLLLKYYYSTMLYDYNVTTYNLVKIHIYM